jgi:dihydrofolate reductase
MKVILYPAVSLDGFITQGATDSDWVNEEDDAQYQKEITRTGCVIMGRTTYEQYKADIDGYDDRTTFVATSKPLTSAHDRIIPVAGSPAEILKEIEARGFTELVLCGGGETNGRFAEAGLIDEIKVSIYPLILGQGIRLFGDYEGGLKLELLSSKQGPEGITQNHYKIIPAA